VTHEREALAGEGTVVADSGTATFALVKGLLSPIAAPPLLRLVYFGNHSNSIKLVKLEK